ncbi:hypothetical protein DYB30_003214 [Aphanomyces astaci]|uniref:Protein kinase domain-containing protein n=2 Tax=Aphanomyces astaci TaxID=112090 RepID=A0A397DAT7_APHAT|nr:hypothetical protein DYB30_003214 [Aphanomyces astaci]
MGFFSTWRKEKEDVNTMSLVRMERLYDEMQKRKNGDVVHSADRTASFLHSSSRGGRGGGGAATPLVDVHTTTGKSTTTTSAPSPQELTAHTRELDATLFYRVSCRFLDPTLEQLYQEYCQVEWYVRARNTVMVMMMLHIVFFIVTSMKSTTAEDLLPKDFKRPEEWVQWAYFFAAVPFVAWVDEDSPYVRTSISSSPTQPMAQMWLGYQGSASTAEFRKLLLVDLTSSPSPSCNRTTYDDLHLGQINKNLLSAFVALAAIFLILIGSTLAVVIRLDFPQVVLLLAASSAALVAVLHLYALSMQAVIVVSYASPGFLLCMACYHSDRSARRSFLAKIHVEKENADLQFTLNKAEKALLNDPACDAETHAVRQVLKSKHLEMIQIPFADLKFEKIIGRGASGEVIKRFREEIELMSCLRHPNIVQFIGASWDNCSNVCMVLEYMEHGDMHSVLHSAIGRSFVWSDPLLKMAVGAVSGMLYLHSQVSDFGLSRRYKKDIDALTTVVGTPFWLAPEVIRNEKYGISADIYSFGIVLTELETRQTPYHDIDQTGLKVMLRVAKDGLRPSLPSSCLPRRRRLIQDCLLDPPRSRPTFLEVLHRLQGEVREEIEADAEKLAIDRRALLRTKAIKREQSVRRLDQL